MLKEFRSYAIFILFHNIFVHKLCLDLLNTLNVSIRNLTVFVTFTFRNFVRPLDAIEFEVEIQDVERMHHVDKGKSYTLLRLQIFGQIKVIINVLEFLVNDCHHFSLIKLNGYVLDHERSLPQDL